MGEPLLLDCGSGGRASRRLISEIFLRHFDNPVLAVMDDAARLEMDGPIAMSTDSYTVTPLFFPGGSIGTLAVHGTVNDVAMLGAEPLHLSASFILEEGLDLELLERIAADMGEACRRSGVSIVTGDTKVVPKGACDKIFITTTGIGRILVDPPELAPSGHRAAPGDAIIISGAVGDHGLTVLAGRENLSFLHGVRSDSAALNLMTGELVRKIAQVAHAGDIHVLRDPTRGGLATTLNEIAEQSNVVCVIEESAIPVHDTVRSGCDILGLDPLYLANEGKCLCFVPQALADTVLNLFHTHEAGREAARIGTVEVPVATPGSLLPARPGVILKTAIGGRRLLSMLEGDQLPRIC